jgi:hypothetical protein
MHRKCTEADGADGAGSEDKVSEVVKAVRACQNLLGQNGTRLGLLLLLVGPDGDKFGGQAFMEHYIVMKSLTLKVINFLFILLLSIQPLRFFFLLPFGLCRLLVGP